MLYFKWPFLLYFYCPLTKAELEASTHIAIPDQTTLDIVRQNLKPHSNQLIWEVPEVKHQLLQNYIDRIDVVNQNSALVISFRLLDPIQDKVVLLAKPLTVGLNDEAP